MLVYYLQYNRTMSNTLLHELRSHFTKDYTNHYPNHNNTMLTCYDIQNLCEEFDLSYQAVYVKLYDILIADLQGRVLKSTTPSSISPQNDDPIDIECTTANRKVSRLQSKYWNNDIIIDLVDIEVMMEMIKEGRGKINNIYLLLRPWVLRDNNIELLEIAYKCVDGHPHYDEWGLKNLTDDDIPILESMLNANLLHANVVESFLETFWSLSRDLTFSMIKLLRDYFSEKEYKNSMKFFIVNAIEFTHSPTDEKSVELCYELIEKMVKEGVQERRKFIYVCIEAKRLDLLKLFVENGVNFECCNLFHVNYNFLTLDVLKFVVENGAQFRLNKIPDISDAIGRYMVDKGFSPELVAHWSSNYNDTSEECSYETEEADYDE